ncbi:MAG: EamA family transporter [Firmicutes bacterium]|nr:EamA family transporter [Bacillota bacterium]
MNAGPYVALGANVVLLVAGQLLWKTGMGQVHGPLWRHMLLSPAVWAGLALYGIATFLWLFVLTRLPLAVAYPMQATAYVLGMVAARFLLGESVPATSWVGGLLILVGVSLIGWGSR